MFRLSRERKTASQSVLGRSHIVEKRRHPRVSVELPLGYARVNSQEARGGIVTNASEGGILVSLPERIETGTTLEIEIFYAWGLRLDAVKAVAKVVQGYAAERGNLGQIRHGLQFLSVKENDLDRFMALLKKTDKP
jgi:hypothetical protein